GELAAVLPAPEDAGVECRRGWLHRLDAGYLPINLARALARAPQARLLRELSVSYSAARPEGFVEQPDDHIPTGEYCVGICPLLGSPYLGNVRHFRFGADPGDEYGTHNGRAYSGVLLGLIRKMPRLEELELYAEGLRSKELFALSSLTRLRSLK